MEVFEADMDPPISPHTIDRLDSAQRFNIPGYENEDWFIPAPALQVDSDVDLSPEQAEETLKYFTLCSNRVSQMTKTYNDIDAVTRLLEEKEKDLELAARIGQSLLTRNKNLDQKNEQLEQEMSLLSDQVTQLRHELTMKTELLQIYAHDLDYSESDSNSGSPTRDRISLHISWEVLQKKIRKLEDENEHLRTEANHLSTETYDFEEKEQQLVKDCVRQLSEANIQVDQLSEEMSKKIDDNLRQQEEITSLLAQMVDLQKKAKKLVIENEDLQQHLQAARECQQELTSELSDFKEKYGEVVEILHDTQEQLRNAIRKGLPGATRRSLSQAGYYNSDSLASELESSLSSENESNSRLQPSEKQQHNLKVFETVRYSKQRRNTTQSSFTSPAHLSHLYTSTASVPAVITCPVATSYFAGGTSSAMHSVTGGGGDCILAPLPPLVSSTPFPSIFSGPPSVDSVGNSDSEGSAVADSNYLGDDESMYSSISSMGRPGIPGSNDLEQALRRLSLRRQSEHEFQLLDHRRNAAGGCGGGGGGDGGYFDMGNDGTNMPAQCRTPDSIMSTGSLGMCPFGYRPYHMPEKLQIIKPMEGSLTLHHWQQLATPHLGGIFEERPGIQVKGERKFEDLDDIYTLTDYEEDEEYTNPGKKFEQTGTIYTYTTSTVLHPDDGTQVTPSLPPTQLSISSSQPPSMLNSPQGRERGTKTFSTTIGLAKMLNERGISAALPKVVSRPPSPTHPYSPTATPCNSPDGSPPGSPPPFSPLRIPSLMALSSGVSRGADLLRRTFSPHSKSRSRGGPNTVRTTGMVTTPSAKTTTVLSSSHRSHRGLSNINLMEKLNRIGLENIMPQNPVSAAALPLPSNSLVNRTSPMAQLTSIRHYVNPMTTAPPSMSMMTTTVNSMQSTPRMSAPSFLTPEMGTIGTLPSLRKGGFL